jgi:peptidyl-prolyl cis-trans isomerase SurA
MTPILPAPARPILALRRRLSVAGAALLAAGAIVALAGPGAARAQATAERPAAEYIVAVVNQELVTASEVRQRVVRLREELRRANRPVPDEAALRTQAVDSLIEERLVLSRAREVGQRIDDAELERAVASVAAQNQLSVEQLRQRLAREGIDYTRFRANVRDQLLMERVREREVQQRIRVTDGDIEALLEQRRRENAQATAYNIAQILVRVPESATAADVAQRRARAEEALRRARGGEPFASLVSQFSDEPSTIEGGGRIGLRTADRLPDAFVEAVRPLQVGQTSPQLIRTGAGFHVLRLAERRENEAFTTQQTRARHILLRVSPQLTQETAVRRLQDLRRQILAGTRSFEQAAQQQSEDASAPQGGDLGWAMPGSFVPEFEAAMGRLEPGAISEPVVSRFGVHLIQVVERRGVVLEARQQREIARNILREQKFDEAYAEWIGELRGRAWLEMRDDAAGSS